MAATIPGFNGCCDDACPCSTSTSIDALIAAAVAGHLFNGYNTNAALRDETVHTDGKYALVYGVLVRGDSFLRIFYFDATSMAVDNAANILKPNDILVGNPGRWIQA